MCQAPQDEVELRAIRQNETRPDWVVFHWLGTVEDVRTAMFVGRAVIPAFI